MRRVLSGFLARKGAKAQRKYNFAALRLCVSILSLLVLGVGTAVAQSEVVARLTAVQVVAQIGEPIQLVLEVDHPAGWRVIAPQLAEIWGDFEVREQSAPTVLEIGDGRESSQMMLAVVVWELGEFSTPTLSVTVSNPQGELVEVTADPVTIQVETVLAEDDLALRDIKPQAALPLAVWWPWLAGGLGLMGVLGVIWWRGRRGETAVPYIDNRSPHQVALDDLNGIATSGLAERGEFKGYYAQTTDVLRHYLDGTLGLRTEEQTTGEIRQAIQPLAWQSEDKKLLVNLLNEADLVKFAKVKPTLVDARRATDEAKLLVMVAAETSTEERG